MQVLKNKRRWLSIAAVLALLLVAGSLTAQEAQRHIALILDASGSMQAALDGSTRLVVAKDAIINLSTQLADNNTQASLWVYGHRLPQDDPAASCQDIEEVIPSGPVDAQQFATVVGNLNAIGYTPISTTLQMAAERLPAGGNNTIVLVSDGEETCSGNPCAVAQALDAANVDLVVNTIGFAADAVTREQLACIAEVTGGIYLDAPNADDLNAALVQAAAPPATVRIVDPDGNVLPDIPFQVTDTDTNTRVGTFASTASLPAGSYEVRVQVDPAVVEQVTLVPKDVVDIVVMPIEIGTIALVDPEGNPITDLSLAVSETATSILVGTRNGSINVPPGDYTVEIRTLIPFETTATVVNGETTEIVVDNTLGTIVSVDGEGNPIDGIAFVITVADTGKQLYANGRGAWDVPPGTYDVEVRALIPFSTQVTVGADEVVPVTVDTTTGTIFTVDQNNNPVSGIALVIRQADSGRQLYANGNGSWDVPPGTYDIEIRTIVPTTTQVTVGPDESVPIAVDLDNGTIVAVDLDGNPVTGIAFQINAASTGDQLYANGNGEWEVPPGTYDIEIRTLIRSNVQVTVGPGETVEVPVDTRTGTIISVDTAGNPIGGIAFVITVAETGQQLYANGNGAWDVPPGTYDIEVRADTWYTVTVTVGVDETVPVTVE